MMKSENTFLIFTKLWQYIFFLAFFICGVEVLCAKEKPFFKCSFENKSEIIKAEGLFHPKAKFVRGISGKAIDLKEVWFFVKFPAAKSIPKTEGTLLVWLNPYWNLPGISFKKRLRLFSVMNKKSKSVHKYNYFCILGHSFGNPSRQKPHMLYSMIRRDPKSTANLLLPNVSWKKDNWYHIAVVWRINTNRKNGVFKFYLNGRMIVRKTDFRAYKIEFGNFFTIIPKARVDELSIWSKILTDKEIKKEYNRLKK